ncbi:hypothetical protein ASPACDRAFT_60264 [Aspergillus aculeatus ATCC 16872]|uniref:Uncharacterized protein n=1 Tax=Aspergillus aculeatus (strain ATCC 16872 / CBS 172.66 / WB 5094) TaxID=690307 RepID=A0A1L9WW02_ASPA1|nr:uncharacterized protein ASPACDRAFT_60264 [Aspergillus aculeatus ATCC 16872]OJK00435.1 hypothetical protein ASPACDRAFT_60264 [Aspergillus aculeatus ATCC 16872]
MAPQIGKPLYPTSDTESVEEEAPALPILPTTGTGKTPLPLHHHSLITTDFDALRFHAAAALQLRFPSHKTVAAALPTDTHLIVSPYNQPGHLLDLRTLDRANQLLAQALTTLQPTRPDYATAPYTESFNWASVFELLRQLALQDEAGTWPAQSFYVVTFRSRLRADADGERLYLLDAHSHQEAMASGGLLKYWFGSKDASHRNLATCIWRSREDARLGGLGPWHKKARGAAREMYESIEFSTLRLTVAEGVRGWEFGEWVDEN